MALQPQPDRHARGRPAREQHLQLRGRAVRGRLRRRLPRRRHPPRHERPCRPERGRHRVGDRPRPDLVRRDRRTRGRDPGGVPVRLRPARDVARGSLLRHLVRRIPRPDDRRRVHPRLRDVPPPRQRVPAVQPERRALPAQGRRELRDALAAERRRSHAVRGRLLLGEPRPRALGTAPARARASALDLAVDESRRRADADRDRRGLARALPRRPHLVQRLRLLHGRGAPRPRGAVEGRRARKPLPAGAARAVRAGRRRAERRLPVRGARGRRRRPALDLLRRG